MGERVRKVESARTRRDRRPALHGAQDPNRVTMIAVFLPYRRACEAHRGLAQMSYFMSLFRHSAMKCGPCDPGRKFTRIHSHVGESAGFPEKSPHCSITWISLEAVNDPPRHLVNLKQQQRSYHERWPRLDYYPFIRDTGNSQPLRLGEELCMPSWQCPAGGRTARAYVAADASTQLYANDFAVL